MSTNESSIAGPSRRTNHLPNQFPKSSTMIDRPRPAALSPRTPARSLSLTARTGKSTHHTNMSEQSLQPPTPTSLNSPLSPTSPISIRRAISQEPLKRDTIRTHPHPHPHPSYKDIRPLPSDPLFKAARVKLSSIDQEAMRKLRTTMEAFSDTSSSHSNQTSPQSPKFPMVGSSASGQGQGRELGSRRSTLSRHVMMGNEQVGETSTTGESLLSEPAFQVNTKTFNTPADYVIAVVGHGGVGKTTIIHRALKTWGVSDPVAIATSNGHPILLYSSQVQPGGKLETPSRVDFIEIQIDALRLSGSSRDIWPESLPPVSGVILCYDATRNTTLGGIPAALDHLAAERVSTVMMACKSDGQGDHVQVDPAYANALGETHNIGLIEVTTASTEGRTKMRNGVRWLIHKLEQRAKRRQHRHVMGQDKPSPPLSASPGHASQILELISAESDASSTADRLMWHGGDSLPAEQEGQGGPSETDSSSTGPQWSTKGSSGPARETDGKGGGEREGQQSQKEVVGPAKPGTPQEPDLYISLEDLFNRLFTSIVSNENETFIKAFFMTYRRFCHPRELMRSFLERMKEVQNYAVVKDIQHWTIQKLTGALIDWTSRYPGDIAGTTTQEMFREALGVLLKQTFMSHLTVDLVLIENSLFEVTDIDASWSVKATGIKSSLPSSSQTELYLDGEVLYDFESPMGKSELSTPITTKNPSTRTLSSASIGVEPQIEAKRSRSASDPRLASFPSDEIKLEHLMDEGSTGRWAIAYNQIMTTDSRTFAIELSKMQWQLFVAIRPRDVLRHELGKEKEDPVGRAIDFFNHLSRWVSTMILSHSKSKYRARIYERFMLIVQQLRRLNNYDSLYAVISGMRETSVYRLSQTHALVQPSQVLEREFQGYLKLMDPRGGYAEYRKVLSGDISHGRPAIPLLTTVLAMISRLQGVRRQDIRADGMVHWDKFARFAEILTVIPDCQANGEVARTPGLGPGSLRALIMDTPVIHDEDGLFERSRVLEPMGGGGGNKFRRFGKLGF